MWALNWSLFEPIWKQYRFRFRTHVNEHNINEPKVCFILSIDYFHVEVKSSKNSN